MMNFGRWVVLGVCGAALLGCGGKSKPKPDEETGIILEFFDVDANGRTDQEWDDLLTYEDGKNKQKGNDTSVSIKRFENFDLDDYSEDVEMMILSARLKYVNNTLDEIDFDLRSYDFGYNIEVYARNTDGSRGRLVWSFEDSLGWCINGMRDDIFALRPDPVLYPEPEYQEIAFYKDYKIDSSYSGPASLQPAEEWSSTEDDRLQTCPFRGILTGWTGRYLTETMDPDFDPDFDTAEEQKGIREIILGEYQAYLDYLAAVAKQKDTDCTVDNPPDVCLPIAEVDSPDNDDIVKAVYAKTPFIEEFYDIEGSFHGEQLIFDVVVDISINEFQKSDPFEFTVKIGYQNLD